VSESDPVFGIFAAVLALAGVGEIVASRASFVATMPRPELVSSLLFWEGVAMIACAAVLYMRQSFDLSTIVAFVAIWLAGAAVGALRAGAFDAPPE